MALVSPDAVLSLTSPALVIVADDFGYSPERDEGILLAAERGIVHATSLLVNGVSARAALARVHALTQSGLLQLDVGLHLNLTEGAPLSDPCSIPSLVHDPVSRPYLLGKFGLRRALDAGTVQPMHIRTEIDAQLAAFRAMHPRSSAPSHVDGHQHVHVHPFIAPLFAAALRDAGVSVTRLPRLWRDVERMRVADESSCGAEDAGEVVMPAARVGFYMEVAAHADAAALLFDAHGLKYAAFIGFTTMGADATVPRLVDTLQRAASTSVPVVEWMTHVGHAARASTRAHAAEGCACTNLTCTCSSDCGCSVECKLIHTAGVGEGPDAFALSHDREHELTVWSDPVVRHAFQEAGLRLMRFSGVRRW